MEPEPYHSTIALSPDGKWLVAHDKDFRIGLWKVSTGELQRTFEFPGLVESLAFSKDGGHLVTGNSNGTAYILRLDRPENQK